MRKLLGRNPNFLPNDLRDLAGAFPFEIDAADALNPREHVIGGLAANSNQLSADNPGYEIARHIENFLRSGPVEALAKNRGHRPGEGLDFRAQGHAQMG